MQNKFLKIILIIAIIAIALASFTYYKRMIIDIGCAKARQTGALRERNFNGINCQSWERSIQWVINVGN